MHCLLFQVLMTAAAALTASTATHSWQKRAASSCQIYPTNYDYQDTQNQTAQSSLENCSSLHSDDNTDQAHYMDCRTPALLTDGQHGPDNYTSTEHYFIAQDGALGSHNILFTFSSIVTVRDVKLYYYSNVTGNKSLPRVSVYIVSDGFNIWESPRKSWIVEAGPSNAPSSAPAGLRQEIIAVNSASRKWLFRFRQLEHQLYLSEVAFFSCTITTAVPLELTTQAAELTTASTQVSSTTPATLHAKPGPFTRKNTEITSNVGNDQSSKLLNDYLPWLLMGVTAMLLCALLTANIVCCIVCILKRHKKKKLQLKRNPSYVSSPRIVDAHNYAFENHIYDIPASTM